jgi:predicted nucleic acid-binding protein
VSLIVNNTVLSNFAFVDRLDLLKNIFQKVYLTPKVYREVEEGIRDGYEFQEHTRKVMEAQEWLIITEPNQRELELYRNLLLRLGSGEASCLAIAKGRGWLFLTDDLNARKTAIQLDVRISGTIGVLRIAMEQGFIPIEEGNRLLHSMIDNGYFSPISDLSLLL